jgi:hypothetical protein
MRGTSVSILVSCTCLKVLKKGKIHAKPVLLACRCGGAMKRLESLVRKTGILVSFQWHKDSLAFVKGLREKVEDMGYEKN